VDAEPTARTVVVDGATVKCTLAGVESEDADPVVLVPGLGGSIDRDLSFLLPLLARTHRVMAVDLRFGPSTDLEAAAAQLGEAIRQLLPRRRVTLVGFSVGASVAAAHAAGNSGLAGLVLVAPVLRPTVRHRLLATLRAELASPGALDALDVVTAYSPAFLDGRTPGQLAALRPFPPEERTAAQIGMFANADLTDTAPLITAPVLVVGCTEDDIGGVDQARAFFAALPNARYAEIDSGHAVLAERPAEVLALVRDFASSPLRHRPGSVLEGARP
jgi:pimeloyl-ACP methyl ester carboxylesterase